jgi:hypothetical protein
MGLVQLVRFLLVKLIHTDSNSRFDMIVVFTITYFFSVGDDIPVDSDVLLVTDFMNLKIKPAQFFGCTHRGTMCVCS